MASQTDTTALLEMYRRMRLIRAFELRAAALYRDGAIPGFLHLSIGQEACAVGACWPLEERDVITSTHRGHGHCIAKGIDTTAMFAELMGKETGVCKGRGGSMHIADPGKGIFGANGIVGAGLPIAAGAAAAAQLRRDGAAVVAFFGDGAVAQGMFHEAVNLAASWQLPVLFFCENNKYAEFSATAAQQPVPLAERARGYGVEFHTVDGNDVVAVAELIADLVAARRDGKGPVMVEADTYRWHGHYEGDPQRYRDPAELTQWKQRDPLDVLAARLDRLGVPADALEEIHTEVNRAIEDGVRAAHAAREPAAETLWHYVTAPREPMPEPATPAHDEIKTGAAIREALVYELNTDDRVFLAGIDIGDSGNVFGLTRGLAQRFPGRVKDTPISESAILGTAVGAALGGMRPVVEIMYFDFVGACFDQLLNQAAKLRFMTGGNASLPLVVRTQFGAGRSSGSQHSQSLEAVLAHIPGLTVVMPATPADAYGLLRAAVRDPNPVIFVENRLLYGHKGAKPPDGHLVPLGTAKVRREGTDVTLVSYSRMVHDCLAAARLLVDEGVSTEVIDLRTIAPLDRETVLISLAKTNRLVVAHEAVGGFGVGAELAALAANEGFWTLDAPVRRVAAAATPAPYAPSLERLWLPGTEAIAAAIRETVAA